MSNKIKSKLVAKIAASLPSPIINIPLLALAKVPKCLIAACKISATSPPSVSSSPPLPPPPHHHLSHLFLSSFLSFSFLSFLLSFFFKPPPPRRRTLPDAALLSDSTWLVLHL